jgi:hypothetical protein
MIRHIIFSFVFFSLGSNVWAACTPPLAVKDGNGNSVTMSTKSGADANCQSYFDVDTASNLYTAITGAIPSGGNTIGAVGADPSLGKGTPSSAAISMSTATTTQFVATLSGITKIYITSFDVIAGGTTNVTLVYGTGSNCGTGTTSLTGAYPLTAQAGISKGSGVAAVLVVPGGNNFCVTSSQSVQVSGSVSYQVF